MATHKHKAVVHEQPEQQAGDKAITLITKPTARPYKKFKTVFGHIPIRGVFTVDSGSPTGVLVKVSSTTAAQKVVIPPAGTGRYGYRCQRNLGGGRYNIAARVSPGDFLWFDYGHVFTIRPNVRVTEANPSDVLMEADKRDW